MNNTQVNQQNNYIKVSNLTNPGCIIRCKGFCTLPYIMAEFISLPCRSGENIILEIPNDAGFTLVNIERYNTIVDLWVQIFTVQLNFPGSFCYNVIGTVSVPILQQVPCPNINDVSCRMCCNNTINQVVN